MFVNTTITTILCIQASNLWYFIKSSRAADNLILFDHSRQTLTVNGMSDYQ